MTPRLRRAALGAGLACATLVAVEAGLRLAALGWSARLLRAWREPPPWGAIRRIGADGAPSPVPGGHARWALQPGSATIDYRTDERGFRVVDADTVRSRAACAVLVAGDSNAFGYGVAAADALPGRLAQALVEDGLDADVANAGLCGGNVVAQRRWLDDVLARERPDVVVLVLSPWSLRTDDPSAHRDATAGERAWNVLEQRLRAWSAVSALVERTERVAGHAAHRIAGWPPESTVARELEPLLEDEAVFRRRLTDASVELGRIVAAIRRRGAAPVLGFVPLDVQVSRARNRLYAAELLPYRAFGFDDRDYTATGRYAALAAIAARMRLPFADATPALRAFGADAFLPDDYHLSALGHAALASAIVPQVARACDAVRAPGKNLVAAAGERR